jgi:hypothetical protein
VKQLQCARRRTGPDILAQVGYQRLHAVQMI